MISSDLYSNAETLSKNKLQILIKRILKYDISLIDIGDMEPYQILNMLYKNAESHKKYEFQEKLKQSVSILLKSYNAIFDDIEYIRTLVFLIGLWKSDYAADYLYRCVYERRFINNKLSKNSDEDLNLLMLKSLLSINSKNRKKIELILNERVKEPFLKSYAHHYPFCFKYLVKINPNYYFKKYFIDLVKLSFNGACYLPGELRWIVKYYNDYLVDYFEYIDPFPMKEHPLLRLYLTSGLYAVGLPQLYDKISDYQNDLYVKTELDTESVNRIFKKLINTINNKSVSDFVLYQHSINIYTYIYNNDNDYAMTYKKNIRKAIFKYFSLLNCSNKFTPPDNEILYKSFVNEMYLRYMSIFNDLANTERREISHRNKYLNENYNRSYIRNSVNKYCTIL